MPIDCQLAGSELYDKDAPGIFFSSVVAQELLAGARTLAGRKRGSIITAVRRGGPNRNSDPQPVERCGNYVSESSEHPAGSQSQFGGLLNDCLLALSARSLGATLYTSNRDDFILLRIIRSFSLVVIS